MDEREALGGVEPLGAGEPGSPDDGHRSRGAWGCVNATLRCEAHKVLKHELAGRKSRNITVNRRDFMGDPLWIPVSDVRVVTSLSFNPSNRILLDHERPRPDPGFPRRLRHGAHTSPAPALPARARRESPTPNGTRAQGRTHRRTIPRTRGPRATRVERGKLPRPRVRCRYSGRPAK